MVGRYEWIILELLFLGVLVYELVSVKRSLRKDRAAAAAAAAEARKPDEPAG